MKVQASIAPLYIDGKRVYPETTTTAVKIPDGGNLQTFIESIKRLGTDELRELKEVIDQIVLFDMYDEDEEVELVDRDADTVGGLYTADDIKGLLDSVTELTRRVEALENKTPDPDTPDPDTPDPDTPDPDTPDPDTLQVELKFGEEDKGYYANIEGEEYNIQNVATDDDAEMGDIIIDIEEKDK